MLEDTGGSSNQSFSIFNLRKSSEGRPRSSNIAPVPQQQQQQQSLKCNLKQAIKRQESSKQQVDIGAKAAVKKPAIRSSIVSSSMSQFSRDRSARDDNNIRGRKLSPTTDLGNSKTATGTDSGVHLKVLKTEQEQPVETRNAAGGQSVTAQSNKPLLSYSSEYVGYPPGGNGGAATQANSSRQVLRSQRQTRSSSLLQSRYQENCGYTSNSGGAMKASQQQTAKFAGGNAGSSSVNQYQLLKQSQSLAQICDISGLSSDAKRRQQSKLLQQASKNWQQTTQKSHKTKKNGTQYPQATEPSVKANSLAVKQPTGKQNQNNLALAKNQVKMTQNSALIMKPPKTIGQKVASKAGGGLEQQPLQKRPKTSLQQSSTDLTKKKQSSVTPTTAGGPPQPQVIRKLSAVASQKITSQPGGPTVDHGAKPNNQLQRGSSKVRSQTALASHQQSQQDCYRTPADLHIKRPNAASSQEQRSQIMANPQVLDQQRNESGGTGEVQIQQVRPIIGRPTSSSPVNHVAPKKVVEEPNFLRNSRSSFQLTFSQQRQQIGQQKQKQTIERESSPSFNHNNFQRVRNQRSRETFSRKDKQSHAVSHSPRERQQDKIVLSAWSQGEALKMFKKLQKKVKEPVQQLPPYLSKLSTNHHSRSVIENRKLSKDTQSQESLNVREHSQARSSSDQDARKEQVKLLNKMLDAYQKSMIRPAQEKLTNQRQKIRRELTPTGKAEALAPQGGRSSTITAQELSKREKKEQKQRMKELRQKRKAIEAKTREMKLKSVKHAHLNLHPSRQKDNQPTPQTSLKSKGKTDMQNIANTKQKPHGTPSYTIVRSSHGFKDQDNASSSCELLNAVSFQRHVNLPLQMDRPSTKAAQSACTIKVLRDTSNSSSRERVEWEPLISRGVPLRQKATGKPFNNNLRKRESLGLEYIKVKRELAAELPLSQPKKLKTVTPAQRQNNLKLKEKGVTSVQIPQKKVIKQILEPRILESERYHIVDENNLRVDDSHRKKTLEPQLLQSDRSMIAKEKQKKHLVEQQKRNWQQKERVEQMSHISEQQRILKNLHKVNKVARVQAKRAVKKHKAAPQPIVKSTRGNKRANNDVFHNPVSQHDQPNYQVTQFQDWQRSSSSEADSRIQRSHGSPDKVFNVQIRSVTETISANSSNNNLSQVQAYFSPMVRNTRSGTTGAAESDQVERRRSGRSIRSNAVRKKARQESSKDSRLQLKLNPATLYQLSCNQNGLTYDDNLRQSSQSQRQSVSQSSNLNYSPTTTIGQRSNSHSTQQARQRSESSNKNRGSSQHSKSKKQRTRNTGASNHLKSTSSKASRRKQSNHLKNSDQKKTLIKKFRKNSMTLGTPQFIKTENQIDLQQNSDDVVIFIILTQAAQMIQKVFRGFLSRKRIKTLKQRVINQIESELEKASGRQSSNRRSSREPNISSQIQSVFTSIQSINQGDNVQKLNISKKQSQAHQQQRKNTFSFGTDIRQNEPAQTEPVSFVEHNHSLQAHDLESDQRRTVQNSVVESLIRNSAEGKMHLHGKPADLSKGQKKKQTVDVKQTYALQAKETAKFKEQEQRNVFTPSQSSAAYEQLGDKQTHQNIEYLYEHQDYESGLQMDAGSESEVDNSGLEEQDSMLQFEKVSPKAVRNIYSDVQQRPLTGGNNESQVECNNISISVCSDDIRSHIFAEAGEDFSLQQIMQDQQRRATEEEVDDSSIMIESVAERTDKIINYSGALNTSEDLIQGQHMIHSTFNSMLNTGGEAANTCDLINPYSIQLPNSNKAARRTIVNSEDPSVDQSVVSDYTSLLHQQQQQNKPTSNDSPLQVQLKKPVDQSRKSLMRMVSGDERFLIKHSGIEDPYFTQGNNTREAVQVISDLQSKGNQSMDEYQIKPGDNSFHNAMYPLNSQSSFMQQNMSQVSLEHSKDSLSLLKQGYGQTQSSFLNTNASIFERNPFQDFTASKLNALFTHGKSISGGKVNIEQLIQVKEDALKFISQLEKRWIARQESLSILTPRASRQKRYELEQWVSSQNPNFAAKPQRSSLHSDESGATDTFEPSASQIKSYQGQVEEIVSKVNKKADEIREQLYQRSQDENVRQQQIEGYQGMKLYKKALGMHTHNAAATSLNNIDVIDQSLQEGEDEEDAEDGPGAGVGQTSEQPLEISKDEFEEATPQGSSGLKSPPELISNNIPVHQLNNDLPPSPTRDQLQTDQQQEQSAETDQNERLSEEITDRILAHLLEEEFQEDKLAKVFKRESVVKLPSTSPGGTRVRRSDQFVEVAVTSDANFNINQSISVDQIIAGVDTSIEAVDQYVEGIFAQIRIRAKQFMNAFYTPIYRNPMAVLAKIQKQGIAIAAQTSYDSDGQPVQPNQDLTNTLSSILNVQLYLTLEKARENVIRDALQQIKEQAQEGEDLAINSNLSELLSESDHIHNKAIFDAVNESLNLVRPYGRLGEPMPWSTRPRKNFFPYANETDLDRVLGTVKKTILDWAEIKAGQISSNVVMSPPDPQKNRGSDDEGEASVIKQAQFKQISEETLALQREKSLAKLLTHEIQGQEEMWLDYEAQETQVKVDMTDHILEQLVEEIAKELTDIQSNRDNKD